MRVVGSSWIELMETLEALHPVGGLYSEWPVTYSPLKNDVEHVFNVLIFGEHGHAGSVPHVFQQAAGQSDRPFGGVAVDFVAVGAGIQAGMEKCGRFGNRLVDFALDRK
jgi:hypothetical protein